MRFSVEQIFLTDGDGKPLADRATTYDIVEADTLDAALSSFLFKQEAEVIGAIQRFHGANVIATAQQGQAVFIVHLMLGSDAFRASSPSPPSDTTRTAAPPARDERPDQRQ